MKPYNVLSLFGGIETGYAALVDAGIPISNYHSSEIDKHAIAVTKHNYPKIKHVGCIVKFARYFCASPANLEKMKRYQHTTAKTLRTIELVQDIKIKGLDLCIGGSPCQGFSFAGKLAVAAEKSKSGLFDPGKYRDGLYFPLRKPELEKSL